MTPQEIFDYVACHLANQGRKSEDQRGCCYRTDQGDACAVGCLIPDRAYDAAIEGRSLYKLLDRRKKSLPYNWTEWLEENPWFEKNYPLLFSLQNLHDSTDWFVSQELFESLFRLVARSHSLSDAILENIVLTKR